MRRIFNELMGLYCTNYLVIILLSFSIFTVNSAFADCGPSTLQYHYYSSDTVFHGTLISTQYDSGKSNPATWTFAMQESFKGLDSKEVIVTNADGYGGDRFKQGLDYIVFAQGTHQPLEIHLCDFQYYAFPTVLNMVSQLYE